MSPAGPQAWTRGSTLPISRATPATFPNQPSWGTQHTPGSSTAFSPIHHPLPWCSAHPDVSRHRSQPLGPPAGHSQAALPTSPLLINSLPVLWVWAHWLLQGETAKGLACLCPSVPHWQVPLSSQGPFFPSFSPLTLPSLHASPQADPPLPWIQEPPYPTSILYEPHNSGTTGPQAIQRWTRREVPAWEKAKQVSTEAAQRKEGDRSWGMLK